MKKLFCLACALFAAFAVSAQQLPDVQVENAEGQMVSIRSLAGEKPLIIAYWSIACKNCIHELDNINEQLDEWRELADFEVIAVSTDDVRLKAAARSKSASRGWEFIRLFDENQTLKRAMNVSNIPHSFVVDREGNIVLSHTGYENGSEQELLDKILELNKK